MVRLSSTLIYDSIRIAEWLRERPICERDSISFLTRLLLTIEAKTVLDWLCFVRAVKIEDGFYKLSDDYLRELVSYNDDSPYFVKVRGLLKRYILNCKPTWSSNIIYGRREVFFFLTEDEQRCFIEAKLMNECDSNTVEWWDSIANRIRSEFGISLNEEGRTGENLTISYEKQRTGLDPKWASLDSNLLGYDVDSFVGPQDQTHLYIEVKTTNLSDDEAVIYISKHEWEVADSNPHYAFYVWSVHQNKTKLLMLCPDDVRPHIPRNSGVGTWENVKIRIKDFIETYGWEEVSLC